MQLMAVTLNVFMGERSIEAVYRRFYPVIVGKCHRMLGDAQEAEDLAQEVFIRFWHHQGDLAPNERAQLGWIYKVATRLSIDRIRKSKRQRTEQPEDSFVAADGFDPVQRFESRDLIRKLLPTLTEEELEVLLLTRIDGMTAIQIAETLGIGERTVRRRLSAAQTTLDAIRGVA